MTRRVSILSLALVGCAAAPRPPETPRVVVVPAEWEVVVEENASAVLVRDCHVAQMVADHDSGALVPVCIHYPSVYL